MSDYWFVLSYSRNDDRDKFYIEKFYRDLAARVATKASLGSSIATEEVGFWDQESIQPGADWKSAIKRAIEKSKTFVCLYSTSYFNSRYCGQEWQVFYNRLQAHLKASPPGTDLPPLILPILWDPYNLPKELPGVASNLDYDHISFGEVYAREGLDHIMRLNKFADDYQEFLNNFSEKLVDAAIEHPILGTYPIPSLNSVSSAFHPDSPATAVGGGPPSTRGPRYAKFVFVVGRRDEMQGIKESLSCYGYDDKRTDWCPYRVAEEEDHNHMIGIMAQKAATEVGLIFETLVVDENILAQLRKAEKELNIVVFVVDPWSLRLETYEEIMQRYDESRFINSGVLIPWNAEDPETSVHLYDLNTKISDVFRRNILLKDTHFRNDIRSKQDLRESMLVALSEVRKLIASKGPSRHVPSGTGIPTVSGSY